jgi:hypothetical protein
VPFGYGYGKVATNLSDSLQGKAPSFYLRKSFAASAAQVASQADLVLTTEFDDGIIIFLNGTEVGRCNLGAPGLFVYSDQVAFEGRPRIFSSKAKTFSPSKWPIVISHLRSFSMVP